MINLVCTCAPEVGGRFLPGRLSQGLRVAASCRRVRFIFIDTSALPVRLLPSVGEYFWMDDRPTSLAAFSSGTSFQECAEVFFDWCQLEAESRAPVEFLTSKEYEAKVGRATYCY